MILGYGSWSNGRGSWSDSPMVVGGGSDGPMVDDCGSMGMGRGSQRFNGRGFGSTWVVGHRSTGFLWVLVTNLLGFGSV